MKIALIQEMQTKLEEEQRRLRKELGEQGKEERHGKDSFTPTFPEFGSEEDDQAAEVATYEDRLSIDRDLEKELQDVDRALAGVDAGTYGTCSVCNLEIDEDRLRAMPTAHTCKRHMNEAA